MSAGRENFLRRVREALRSGNQPGQTPPLQERGRIGYQGGGLDPLARFQAELTAAGGLAYPVSDREAAVTQIVELIRRANAKRILLGRGSFLDTLKLADHLRAADGQIMEVDKLTPDRCRDPLFAAEVGISGVAYLIAETGTIVVRAQPSEPRSLSLLPPAHIAVAERSQLVPDLFDVFALEQRDGTPDLPSCISFITGPSKTGDIELRLVTGVHGPGELHVIVVGT
jgi:L-lactate utilization protein LutC